MEPVSMEEVRKRVEDLQMGLPALAQELADSVPEYLIKSNEYQDPIFLASFSWIVGAGSLERGPEVRGHAEHDRDGPPELGPPGLPQGAVVVPVGDSQGIGLRAIGPGLERGWRWVPSRTR